MRLKDKVILVTGSTTGIGEAIARRAWQEGATVVLHGRDIERGYAIADELKPRATFLSGDLADADVPKQLIEQTVSAFDKLDAVVNNAAWVIRSDIYTTDVGL